MRILFLMCAVAVAGSGQSLQVLPSPAESDGGSFRIMLATAKARIAALQWQFSVTGGVVIASDSITSGSAAQKGGKFLHCSALPPREGEATRAWACVLAGTRTVLEDGPVALIRYRATPSTGDVEIRVTRSFGASPDAEPVAVAAPEVKVIARRPR